MLPSEEYVESGYFLASDYVGGIADAVGILGGYFAEGADYVETGYLLDQTVQFTIVINTDGAVQEASATLASAVSFLATVSRIRPADVTLNNIANLNAQAAITRTTDSNLSAAFDIGHDDGGFQTNVQPSVTFDSSSTQNSTTSLTTDALLVKFGDSTQNSSASLTSTPIEYRSKWVDSSRPISWEVVRWDPNTETWISDTNYAFDSSVKKYGTHSLLIEEHTGSTARAARSDTLGLSSADRGKDWAIDFWFRSDAMDSDNNTLLSITTLSTDVVLPGYAEDPQTATSSFQMALWHDGGRLELRAKNNSGTFVHGSSSTIYDMSSNTWYHIQVIYDESAGTLTLKRNNNTIATLSGDYDNWWGSNTRLFLHNPQQSWNGAGFIGSNFYFDELHFRIGNNTVDSTGYDYGTEDTKVLAHFDNNFDDDLSAELFGSSSLSSAVSVSATIGGTLQGSAVLDTNAGFAVVANATKVGETVLDAVATTTVVNDRIRTADSTLNSAAGITTSAQRIRSTAATLDTNGGFAVTAQLTASGETVLTGVFATVGSGTVTRTDTAQLDSQFDQSATAIRNRFGSADLTSSVAITAEPLVTKQTSANFSSTVSINAVPSTTKPSSAVISALYSTLTVAAKIGDFLVSADSTTTISVSGTVTRTNSAELAAVATLAPVAAAATRSGSGDLVAEGTLTSSGRLTAAATATLNSTATLGASGDRIRSSSTVQAGIFSASMTPTKISPFAIDINSAFAVDTAPTYIRGASAELDSVASITPNAGVLYEGAAELTGFAAIVSVNKVLHLDQYVYVIPRENKTYTIPQETREYSVTRENRTLVIEGS